MTDKKSFVDKVRDHTTTHARHAHPADAPPSLDRRAEAPLTHDRRERVMADLSATPKETVVGSFRTHSRCDPLPPRRRYGGPSLAGVTLVNEAQFGLHNHGADLLHITVTGTGRWLRMDKPEGFDRILNEVHAQVRITEAL
jgi:hypothetical protein